MEKRHLLVFLMTTILPSTVVAQSSIAGSATYRERMALPPDAVFEASLEDVSRADAGAIVLGRTQIKSPGQPPIHFTISYDSSRVEPQHRYGIRARILVGTQLFFTTDTSYPVSLNAPAPIEILLVRSSASTASVAPLTGLPATFVGDLPCADCEGP